MCEGLRMTSNLMVSWPMKNKLKMHEAANSEYLLLWLLLFTHFYQTKYAQIMDTLVHTLHDDTSD